MADHAVFSEVLEQFTASTAAARGVSCHRRKPALGTLPPSAHAGPVHRVPVRKELGAKPIDRGPDIGREPGERGRVAPGAFDLPGRRICDVELAAMHRVIPAPVQQQAHNLRLRQRASRRSQDY